jgi:hypothetical protein
MSASSAVLLATVLQGTLLRTALLAGGRKRMVNPGLSCWTSDRSPSSCVPGMEERAAELAFASRAVVDAVRPMGSSDQWDRDRAPAREDRAPGDRTHAIVGARRARGPRCLPPDRAATMGLRRPAATIRPRSRRLHRAFPRRRVRRPRRPSRSRRLQDLDPGKGADRLVSGPGVRPSTASLQPDFEER